MNIFITGINSFVGKNLIKKLEKKKNIKIFGCDLTEKNNKYLKINISKNEFVKKIPKKIDTIIHLAAISRDNDCSKNLVECYKSNILGTLNVINSVKLYNIKKIIFASTEWVYPNNLAKVKANEKSNIDIFNLKSEYAKSKLISESHLKNLHLENPHIDITILRFGIIYGERKNNWSAVEAIFNKIKNNNSIEVGSLKTSRKFIHIEDICEGIVKSIKLKKFNIINLQGEKLITLNDIINIGQKILNKKIKVTEKDKKNPSIRNISNSLAKTKLKFTTKINITKGLIRLNKFFNAN